MTATTLEPALQALLEDRLDAVERVLLRNGAGRLERQAVLEEIESRAHELLDARAPENPTRSDLLAALAQLDPPEAYASERVVFAPPADSREEYQGPRRRAVAAAPAAPPRPRVCPIAILALVGGALVGFCGLLASVLALVSDSEEMLLLTGIVAPVALVPFAMGLWSLFRIRASHGQLTGLPLAYAGAAIFPILLFDVAVGILAFVTQFGLYALAILALLQMNVAVGWAGWRLVAQPYSPNRES